MPLPERKPRRTRNDFISRNTQIEGMARKQTTASILAELRYERDRLGDVKRRLSQAQAQVELISAEEARRLQRKRQRRAFVIGEWVLDHADDALLGAIIDGLGQALEKQGDRTLFGLDG